MLHTEKRASGRTQSIRCGEDAIKWWRCDYDDCDGTRVDAIPWVEVREQHPEYPEMPEVGKVYPADTRRLAV